MEFDSLKAHASSHKTTQELGAWFLAKFGMAAFFSVGKRKDQIATDRAVAEEATTGVVGGKSKDTRPWTLADLHEKADPILEKMKTNPNRWKDLVSTA